MRRSIPVFALVLIAAISLVGCNNGSSDSLVKIQFNGPGVMTTNGRYALTDHEYTSNEYSVVAYYSNGTKDVTKEAKIASSSDNVTIGSGNTLTFKDPDSDNENDHRFPLVIEYGGKKLSAEVVAYGAGEAIGGLKNPKTKFLPGEIVSSNIAGIAYLSKEGSYFSSSSSLPSSGYFIYADSEAFYITTVGEGFEYRAGIVPTILYFTYFDLSEETGETESSRQVNLTIESLDPSSIESGRVGILPYYPIAGEMYYSDNFAKLFKEMKVVLKDVDGNNHVVYATDENGDVANGFNVVDISVMNSDGSVKTTGEFVSGDKIKVHVEYCTGVSDIIALKEKVYTVSNRR